MVDEFEKLATGPIVVRSALDDALDLLRRWKHYEGFLPRNESTGMMVSETRVLLEDFVNDYHV